ncbi:related to triacylglycerol lipase [Rhynchosporium graminicola]|uniref:Related to triacylglycerol lipase n=1 Tax=Rhynchosporium graminicola TaxID=2792576 RepID=A0A1E1KL74_9HELO|nr:related to triacylglycerol lipase [Rhynchosporium commune]
MAVGMKFHHFADPKPPAPNFKILIPSRLSAAGGQFKLVFYVPESYYTDTNEDYRYPVVVNFHGGGFTLGTGTDDARWAAAVLKKVAAIFVSVEYRLAPEYPFSIGVEDGTDAMIYLASHAEELRIDAHRMALSGFSAGGNFAFTVPLMLRDLQKGIGRRSLHETNNTHSLHNYKSTSNLSLPRPDLARTHSAATSTHSILKLSDLEPTALEVDQKIPDLTIRAIVSFYPPTDFRTPRSEKRSTNPAPEKNLPPLLTNLFDQSYMPDCDIDLTDPYLSPAAATDADLLAAYPEDIVLYTCEYDMLNVEGTAFGTRLASAPIGKTLHGGLIKAVPHAFDKKPNPLHFPEAADKCYNEACAQLKRVFGGRVSIEERTQLDTVEVVERFDEEEAAAGARLAKGKERQREEDRDGLLKGPDIYDPLPGMKKFLDVPKK